MACQYGGGLYSTTKDPMEDRLLAVIRTIPDKFDTEAVYVFGSYASGETTLDSDIDISVVLNEAP